MFANLRNEVLVGASVRCDDWPRLARFEIGVTRLGFRCAVLISNFVDFVQASRSGVRGAAIRSHSEQFPTHFEGWNRHDVVSALPIFGGHMLGDYSFNRLPAGQRVWRVCLSPDRQQ